MHELSRYQHDNGILFPFKQQLNRVPSLLQQLDQWAHLITDNARAQSFGFTNRGEYFQLLSQIQKDVARALKPVISGADQESIEKLLLPTFNKLALRGDILSDLPKLRAEFEARSEMRIPPGFEDAKKRGNAHVPGTSAENDSETPSEYAGANRFGDYAIWSEILADVASENLKSEGNSEVKAVVLVSHDQKRDWLYIPHKIIDLDGREKPNLKGDDRVTVAHPMLFKELHDRTGADYLHVITVPQLAQIASRRDIGVTLIELARAVQAEATEQEGQEEQGGGDEPQQEPGELPNGSESGQPEIARDAPEDSLSGTETSAEEPVLEKASDGDVQATLNALPQQAFKDRLYRRDPAGSTDADTAIRDLKSLSWYTQNPATKVALIELQAGKPSNLQSFIMGRNIYQAACGSAATPIEVLRNIEIELKNVPDTPAQLFYAGALYEAYFNAHGVLRDKPKAEQIESLFDYQDLPRFRGVVEWLHKQIGDHKNKYLAIPDQDVKFLEVTVEFGKDGVIALAIRYEAIDLAEPASDDENSYARPLGTMNVDRLTDRIAHHFAVPVWLLSISPAFDGEKDFSTLQLRSWGPLTDFRFR